MTKLKEVIERLLNFKPEDHLVVNLYLRLGVEERTDRKYLRTYKDLVKAQREYLRERQLKEEVLKSVEEDFKRLEDFLSDPENLKGCRGIALFSCSNRGLFEVVKLPYVYRNRLVLSHDPLIREIAAIDEDLGRVGLVLIDRKHVRFFLMDLEGFPEIADFLEPLATRAHRFHSGGSMLRGAEGIMRFSMPSRIGGPNMVQHALGEYRFNMRIKEEKHRLFKIASDALMEAWKESKFDKLVIGSDREDIREIENHLHPYLLERLVGYINASPSHVEESELREKVYQLLLEKSREEEKKFIYELQELEGKGLAVNGTSRVLEQLYMGNVRLLIVPEAFQKPGYVCEKSHLPLLMPECPLEDKVYPVPDVVDEIIEFVLEERARIKVVFSEDLQRRIDGLACFMRFAL